MAYKVNMRDIHFNLFEMLNVEQLLEFDCYKEFSDEIFKMVLTEGEKLAVEVIAPTLEITDKDGAKFIDGKVVVPDAIREVFQKYNEGGWGAMSGSPEFGGQGLPALLTMAVGEMTGAANTGATGYQGLTSATANLLQEFGSDYLKNTYCEKMYSGEWCGCMVLTEPQAGSSVGDIATTAKRDGDTYLLTGNKIFITAGDHDMVDNLVHVLLARIEGAPKGIKGLSLFVAPKYLVNEDGSVGEFNNLAATGIEEKMGQHGSATCAIAYGDDGPCRGWIIGEENRGIEIMFTLMDHARIGVGLLGVSHAAAAYELAHAYSLERVQGTRIQDMKDPNAPRVPIVEHPDVRRMLLWQKSLIEACRSMLYSCAHWLDLSHNLPDKEEAQKYDNLVQLLTPVCKAYATEKGYEAICMAMQIHGGYGYCEEYGVSVLMRDAKINSIYEGANGIQALDLLGRKVSMKNGALFMNFMSLITEFCEKNAGHSDLGKYVGMLGEGKDQLAQTTMNLGAKGMAGDMMYPVLYATPYCYMFGHVACAYFIMNQAIVAHEKLQAIFEESGATDDDAKKKLVVDRPEATFYHNKVESAKFFVSSIMPEAYGIAKSIESDDVSPTNAVF